MATGMTFTIIVLITLRVFDLYKLILYPLKNRFRRIEYARTGVNTVVDAVEMSSNRNIHINDGKGDDLRNNCS